MSDNRALARRPEGDTGKPNAAARSPVAERSMDVLPGRDQTPGASSAREQSISMAPTVTAERDLRLDLFRGIALWLIFLDHIPTNIVNWITIRNYGFSDATEIFIFISGYTAAFVYSKAMRERGIVVAGARILRRAWQIYVAHIFLFAIYMAEIAYVQSSSINPVFAEEMGALDFMQHPDETIIQALLLKFKPVHMDVLPLYIVLLLLFPPILWLLQHSATSSLGLSVLLYALNWHFGLNLKSYPTGEWYFNPLAWQLLFVFGAWCALGGAQRLSRVLRSPATTAVAMSFLMLSFAVTLTWTFPRLVYSCPWQQDGLCIPHWLSDWMYPIDKTNLDVLRFAHFLALAAITVRFIPSDWSGLKSPILRPAILCGQHSLEIFCLGVFLAFAGHFVMVEFYPGVAMQVLVSVVGVAVMIGTAALISWYKVVERGSGPPKRPLDADLAGGQV
jgi:hypothetical protein